MAKELFKLEKGSASPLPPVQVTKQQAMKLAKQAEIGDSFNVPFAQWQTVKKMLMAEFASRRFSFSFKLKDAKPLGLTKVTRVL